MEQSADISYPLDVGINDKASITAFSALVSYEEEKWDEAPRASPVTYYQIGKGNRSLLIALGIISIWALNVIFLLSLSISSVHFIFILLAILAQTFLYTGLFVIAHDAMHRSLFPDNYKVNDALGTLCVFLYAFFSYKKLLKKHWLHHRYPASDRDPDFHNGHLTYPVFWFFTFIRRYYGWFQFLTAAAVYNAAYRLFQIPEVNLLLFWILPSLLSSVQLFYFGTFLPHRETQEGYTNSHRTRSNSLSLIWSFLSCYHFGYHEEHHEYPSIPWWQLPVVRRLRLEKHCNRA